MRVLVTGANGFIGREVLKVLHDRDIECVAMTRKPVDYSMKNIVALFHTIGNNLNDRNKELISTCDRMIHLAWSGLPNYKNIAHISDNLIPQYQFIQDVIDSGIKNITITGTCLEYGLKEGCLAVDLCADPRVAYAIAKDSLRRLLWVSDSIDSIQIQWVRLFYIYGNNQPEFTLYGQLMNSIRNKDTSFNMSGGEQVRDYMSVELVAKYLVDVSNIEGSSRIYNCCSGVGVAIKEFVQRIIENNQSDIKMNLGYYPYTDYEAMSFWGEPTKL